MAQEPDPSACILQLPPGPEANVFESKTPPTGRSKGDIFDLHGEQVQRARAMQAWIILTRLLDDGIIDLYTGDVLNRMVEGDPSDRINGLPPWAAYSPDVRR